jgi:hypothetical protein
LPQEQVDEKQRGAMRKNGWKMPFHALQLVTWVVFPLIMALFFAFYTPVFQETTAVIASVVYAAACVVTTASVVVCTGTDPSDDCILRPSVRLLLYPRRHDSFLALTLC